MDRYLTFFHLFHLYCMSVGRLVWMMPLWSWLIWDLRLSDVHWSAILWLKQTNSNLLEKSEPVVIVWWVSYSQCSPLFVLPGPDHSQHTWLWGVVPAWHHFGHLHWPGITDVSNTHHHRPFQPWKLKCWKSQLFVYSFHWDISEDVTCKPKEYEPITFDVLWIAKL